MSERRMARFLAVAFAASGLLHGVAYASLGFAPARDRTRIPVSAVVIEVHEPAPFRAKPEPPKPVPDEREPAPRAAAAPRSPTPEPEIPKAPVDLSGVTLTNVDGEGGFAMPTGDGSERAGPLGPLGPSGPKPAASAAPGPPAPLRTERAPPELVASKDLSERPNPPSLDAALRSLYPDEARRRAISGTASLRVRIGSDGSVREASVLSESFAGFGAACQKAVRGSHWSPPRDRDGRAVQTEVRYTCRFVVD